MEYQCSVCHSCCPGGLSRLLQNPPSATGPNSLSSPMTPFENAGISQNGFYVNNSKSKRESNSHWEPRILLTALLAFLPVNLTNP